MSNPKIKKNINGILLLDKPIGASSNGALQRVKWLFSAKKAGHTGSLDPLATGMLPICFGEATKFSQYLLESDKCYRVKVKLGQKTATGDAEGDIISTRPVENITLERIHLALERFKGKIQQIPPMFSAIKHQGTPLYELARKGVEIERTPREVTIFSISCDDFENDVFSFNVHCSKGTYVRTLVEDLGEVLGCGAHVAELRRTSVTPYQNASMITIDALEALHKEHGSAALYALLLPIETSVQALPAVKLTTSGAFYMRTGQPVMVPHLPLAGLVRIYSNDDFMGVGEILGDGRVGPRRLVAAPHKLPQVEIKACP